jgi:hypothetical protein
MRKNICISLNETEMSDFLAVKRHTGHGATAIFKAMVKSLKKQLPQETATEEDI